jgi:hypothetical protein
MDTDHCTGDTVECVILCNIWASGAEASRPEIPGVAWAAGEVVRLVLGREAGGMRPCGPPDGYSEERDETAKPGSPTPQSAGECYI